MNKKNSFYEFSILSEKEQLYCKDIVVSSLEDYIILYDWFDRFLKLIQPSDSAYGVELEVQQQLNGLEILFRFGKVTDLEHQTILEDLVHEMISDSNHCELAARERATYIAEAWCSQFEK